MARRGGIGDFGRKRISESLSDLEGRLSDYSEGMKQVITGRRSRPPRPVDPADKYPDDLNTLYDLAEVSFGPISVDFTKVQYKGPDRSTRISGVQFLPGMDHSELKSVLVKTIEGEYSKQLLESRIIGYMYIRFHRAGKSGDLGKYGPMTMADYKSRTTAVPSWGKAVNSWIGDYLGHTSAPSGLEI